MHARIEARRDVARAKEEAHHQMDPARREMRDSLRYR